MWRRQQRIWRERECGDMFAHINKKGPIVLNKMGSREAQHKAYIITEVRGPKLKYLQTLYYIFNIIIQYNNIFRFSLVSLVHSNLPLKTEPKFLVFYIIKPN